MLTWKLLFRNHLASKKCDEALTKDRPEPLQSSLDEITGSEQEKELKREAYLASKRRLGRNWDKKEKLARSYLIKSCTHSVTAMTIVHSNLEANCKELMQLLEKRFDLSGHNGYVQTKLAEFNSMELASNEDASNFTTRIIYKKLETTLDKPCPISS